MGPFTATVTLIFERLNGLPFPLWVLRMLVTAVL
jgi:hypothetical protein